MERRRVGGSDVSLSLVGVGGYELGPEDGADPDVDNCVAVLRAALDLGVNWLDTSENYLGTRNEALIGKALAAITTELLVCTKVAPSAAITGGGSGFRPDQIHSACRESLRRLGRDHVDVYLLHWPTEEDVPIEDTWEAMAELADQGLARAIGMSNYDIETIERCHAQRRVDVVQDGLSLIDYLDAREKFRRCQQLGIGVTVFEPLASGILTDKTAEQVLAAWTGAWTESAFYQRLLGPGRVDRSFAVADGIRPVASALGATVAQVAIAWVLQQQGVTAAIAGSGSVQHTVENARAADVQLAGHLETLDALIPLGPTFD